MQPIHTSTLYIHDDIENGQSLQEDDGRRSFVSSLTTRPRSVSDPRHPIQTTANIVPIDPSPIPASHVASSILSSSPRHEDSSDQLSLPPPHLSLDTVGSIHRDSLDTWHASSVSSGEYYQATGGQPLKLCSSILAMHQPSEDDENLLLNLDPGIEHLYHDVTLDVLGTISRPVSIGALAHYHLQALGRGMYQ